MSGCVIKPHAAPEACSEHCTTLHTIDHVQSPSQIPNPPLTSVVALSLAISARSFGTPAIFTLPDSWLDDTLSTYLHKGTNNEQMRCGMTRCRAAAETALCRPARWFFNLEGLNMPHSHFALTCSSGMSSFGICVTELLASDSHLSVALAVRPPKDSRPFSARFSRRSCLKDSREPTWPISLPLASICVMNAGASPSGYSLATRFGLNIVRRELVLYLRFSRQVVSCWLHKSRAQVLLILPRRHACHWCLLTKVPLAEMFIWHEPVDSYLYATE